MNRSQIEKRMGAITIQISRNRQKMCPWFGAKEESARNDAREKVKALEAEYSELRKQEEALYQARRATIRRF